MENAKAGSFISMSLQALSQQAGIKKATFFHHFPSKNQLAVSTLQFASDLLRDYFSQASHLSPIKQLHHYVQLFEYYLEPTQKVCPSVGFIVDIERHSTEVIQLVKEYQELHIHHLTKVLLLGIKQGMLQLQEYQASGLARGIYFMLQGALVSARLTGSRQDVFECRRSISDLLGVDLK